MQRKAKWLLRIALGFAVILLSSWLTLYYTFGYKPEHEARRVIEQFHKQMNNGDFAQISDDAGLNIRSGASRDEWVASMEKIQKSLGRFDAVKTSKIKCEAGPVFLCRASYVSTFEKGETTELFTLNGASGRLRLFEYSATIGGRQFAPRSDLPVPQRPNTP